MENAGAERTEVLCVPHVLDFCTLRSTCRESKKPRPKRGHLDAFQLFYSCAECRPIVSCLLFGYRRVFSEDPELLDKEEGGGYSVVAEKVAQYVFYSFARDEANILGFIISTLLLFAKPRTPTQHVKLFRFFSKFGLFSFRKLSLSLFVCLLVAWFVGLMKQLLILMP